jgi:uncharacterized protein (DUF2126 family)
MNDENLTAKGRGRPPGSQNKIGKAAKEVIAQAAEELGGVDRLVAWAKEDPANEKAFWSTVYPKLLPLTVSGDKDAPVVVAFKLAPLE